MKRYTNVKLQRAIETVNDDSGFEAWRQLGIHCEPNVSMREAQVMAQFTNLIPQRAKNPKETRKVMADFEHRAKRIAEVTGKDVDIRHAKSVLSGAIDPETRKHCSQYHTDGDDTA